MKNKFRAPPNFALERRAAIQQVREIYHAVDSLPVQRNCTRLTECCHFKLTGRTPYLTRGEALLAAQAVRASGRKSLPESRDGQCPLLKEDGRCLIYQDRPFGCRTHFCRAAGGPLSRGEVVDFVHRLEQIDGVLEGRGPLPLTAALSAELSQI